MQDAADGGTSAPWEDRSDLHRAIVSDLVSLIESVQISMELVESAVAGEASLGCEEIGANVIVLDDVTPRYLRVRAALNKCKADLGAALHFLLDIRTPQPGAETGRASPPVRRIGRA
ncbi:MAG TPA: hypothetical protein VF396_08670 [Bradyrhizobium sp.]